MEIIMTVTGAYTASVLGFNDHTWRQMSQSKNTSETSTA
jgi:hypothetical protein